MKSASDRERHERAVFAAWQFTEKAWTEICRELSPAVALEAFCMVIGQQAAAQADPETCLQQAQQLIRDATKLAVDVRKGKR